MGGGGDGRDGPPGVSAGSPPPLAVVASPFAGVAREASHCHGNGGGRGGGCVRAEPAACVCVRASVRDI